MNLEAKFFNLVRYVGILAPLPTAYLIGVKVQEHLKWPAPIAVTTAIIVEGIGFGAVYLFILFREYNQTKRKTDPAAPVTYALALVVAYVVAVLVLTIVLDVFSQAATYAPAIFPFLSLIGMAITALRNDHEARLRAVEEDKAEKKEARLQAKKQETLPQPVPVALPLSPQPEQLPQKTSAVAPSLTGNRAEILRLLTGNHALSQETVAAQLGITRQAVGKHIKFLKENGHLQNGQVQHAA